MSEFRRRLMMAQKKEVIDWDYVWKAPEELPAWLSIGPNATGEMGDGYYRVYGASSPANVANRPFIIFSSTEFPAGNSYMIEMDIVEMAVRKGNSLQSSVQFFSTSNNTPRITRYTSGKVPGTSLWLLGLNTTNSQSGSLHITDSERFKLRVICDTATPKLTLKVGGVSLSADVALYPRTIYSRYVHANKGYWDIYSIKIKVNPNT